MVGEGERLSHCQLKSHFWSQSNSHTASWEPASLTSLHPFLLPLGPTLAPHLLFPELQRWLPPFLSWLFSYSWALMAHFSDLYPVLSHLLLLLLWQCMPPQVRLHHSWPMKHEFIPNISVICINCFWANTVWRTPVPNSGILQTCITIARDIDPVFKMSK